VVVAVRDVAVVPVVVWVAVVHVTELVLVPVLSVSVVLDDAELLVVLEVSVADTLVAVQVDEVLELDVPVNVPVVSVSELVAVPVALVVLESETVLVSDVVAHEHGHFSLTTSSSQLAFGHQYGSQLEVVAVVVVGVVVSHVQRQASTPGEPLQFANWHHTGSHVVEVVDDVDVFDCVVAEVVSVTVVAVESEVELSVEDLVALDDAQLHGHRAIAAELEQSANTHESGSQVVVVVSVDVGVSVLHFSGQASRT
jgi:hypothetical protein